MPNAAVLVALLIFLCPRGLLAQQATAADPLVGCYRVEVGRWAPRDHPEREHPVVPPAEFRLRAEIGTLPFERGRPLVRPLLEGGGGASWERVGADSVRISWGNGFWGTVLLMRIEGESLRGTATSWTDAFYVDADHEPLPNVRAETTARRIPCPTELRGASHPASPLRQAFTRHPAPRTHPSTATAGP
jgi:hypothetical protein